MRPYSKQKQKLERWVNTQEHFPRHPNLGPDTIKKVHHLNSGRPEFFLLVCRHCLHMVYTHTSSQQPYTENKVFFKNLQIIIILLSRILKSKTHSGKVHAPCSSAQHTQPHSTSTTALPFALTPPLMLLKPVMLLLSQSLSISIYYCPAQNTQGLTTS